MKLKLENKGTIAVLVVSAPVAPEHLAILKAGISKMSLSGRTRIILDLRSLTSQDLSAETAAHLDHFSKWAYDTGFQLLTVWALSGFGDCDFDRAALVLDSDDSQVFFEELALAAHLRHLHRRKDFLESKLKPLEAKDAGQLRLLRSENARLTASVAILEKQALEALQARVAPHWPLSSAWKTLDRTLDPFLSRQGLLLPGTISPEAQE